MLTRGQPRQKRARRRTTESKARKPPFQDSVRQERGHLLELLLQRTWVAWLASWEQTKSDGT